MKKVLASIMIASTITSAAFAATTTESTYTDLKKDCVVISSATEQAPIDFYTAECKAFGGYTLEVKGGDIRYHPVLSYAGKEIHIPAPMGFHDTASTKVEWVYNISRSVEGLGQLEWKGLIYRLSQTTEDGEKDIQVLYAVRLDGAKTCLIGTTQDNQSARDMVKNSKANCK